jgi:hypothetical protein
MYSRVYEWYYYLNLTLYVTFNTTSYLEDTTGVLAVQWIANPPVPIRYTVYLTVCSLLAHSRYQNDQFRMSLLFGTYLSCNLLY